MLKRTRPAPPIVILDEPAHDSEAALARRLGIPAYRNAGPLPNGEGTPPVRRPLGLARPPVTQPLDAPAERRRTEQLRALLAEVDPAIRHGYAEALAGYRVAEGALAAAKEQAQDFDELGVSSAAALSELQGATAAQAEARARLGQASAALHAALLAGAEQGRIAAAAEAARRHELLQAVERDHRAAVELARSAEALCSFLTERPRSAVERALMEEPRR